MQKRERIIVPTCERADRAYGRHRHVPCNDSFKPHSKLCGRHYYSLILQMRKQRLREMSNLLRVTAGK